MHETKGKSMASAIIRRNQARSKSNICNIDVSQSRYRQDLTEEEKGELEPIGEWDFFWEIAANVDVRVVDFIGLTITKNATRLLPKQRATV